MNINATQVTAYQYLGMTKIARALNQLPKTFFRYNILNPTTNTIIREYEDDKNYSKFRHDFMKKTGINYPIFWMIWFFQVP
jgi:hypothetical protein